MQLDAVDAIDGVGEGPLGGLGGGGGPWFGDLPLSVLLALCWASYGLVLAPLSRDGVGSTDLDLRRLTLFEADKLKGLTTVGLEAVLPEVGLAALKFRSILEKSTASSALIGPDAGPALGRAVVAKLKGSGRVNLVAISVVAADGFIGAAGFVVATTALALDAFVVCAASRCAVAICALKLFLMLSFSCFCSASVAADEVPGALVPAAVAFFLAAIAFLISSGVIVRTMDFHF